MYISLRTKRETFNYCQHMLGLTRIVRH